MKGIQLFFGYAHLMDYDVQKTNPNRGGPYISSPDQIKNKGNNKFQQKKGNKRFNML